jgi:hypothetical protein
VSAALLLHAVIALNGAAAQDRQQSRGPYLVPQTVYVGDRATLVVPLSEALGSDAGRPGGVSGFSGGTAVLDRDALLPLNSGPEEPEALPVLELHRVELERRPAGARLLVEFSAYAPGILELPPLEIGGNRYSGLRVEISSILNSDKAGAVLSGPAPPLSVPGTSLLIYGTAAVLVLLLALSLGAALFGRRYFGGWIERMKRRRLIVSMAGIEKRIRRNIRKGNPSGRGEILSVISSEFRAFLSLFTGENCRAMTPAELGRLPPLVRVVAPNEGDDAENGAGAAAEAAAAPSLSVLSGGYLSEFFYRCDELRFGGRGIAGEDLSALLGDLKRFLEALDRAERGKIRELRI